MKLFVKTPNGLQYEIEAQPQDTVGDFKKKIETVVGADVYPAARQILVHQGNVLMDCTTLDVINLTENKLILIFTLPEPEAPHNSTASSSSTTPVSTSEVPQPTLAPLESLEDLTADLCDSLSKYLNYIDELGDKIADLCDSDQSKYLNFIDDLGDKIADFCDSDRSKYLNYIDDLGDKIADFCDSDQLKYLNYIDELGDKIADLYDPEPEFNLVDEVTDFTDSHPAPQNTSHADSNMVSGNNLEEEPVVDSKTVSGDSPPEPDAFTIEDLLSPEFSMSEISYINSQRFKDFIESLQALPE